MKIKYFSALFTLIDCINCGTSPDKHKVIVRTKVAHKGSLEGTPLNVVVCQRCGLVFLNPQPTEQALSKFYQNEYLALSSPTEQILSSWEKHYQNFYSWLISNLPKTVNGLNILDIGSGYGVWLRFFDNKSNRLIGVELSKQAADFARSKFGLTIYEMEFMKSRFAKEEFDLITALGIIEHLTNPLKALCEINRILKKGGYLYLMTPNLYGVSFRHGIEGYFKIVHTFYFTTATLSSLLRKAGFEILAFRERPALPDRTAEIDILAQKVVKRNYHEARKQHFSGDSPEVISDLIKTALKRDRFHIWVIKLRKVSYRNRFLKDIYLILRYLFRLAKKL